MTSIPLRETRACINLDAIQHNLRVLGSRVPSVGLVPAVKADGYGHGAVAVAGVCEESGVPMVAVANLEETASLRDHGITIPILILEELFPEEVAPALHLDARLTVSTERYAQLVNDTAGRITKKHRASVHINLDTGMGRMGLFTDDPIAVLQRITSLPNIFIEGLYSHFPTADEQDLSFAHLQVERFQAILAAAADAGISLPYRHLANSGAVLNFPDLLEAAGCNLARPGVSIYGMVPSDEVNRSVALKPAMKLVSRIVKLTTYDRDWTIGYGRTFTARPGSTIAVVPIGYGDGYPRSLSGRGNVIVHGRRVPVVGRVSMDMITLDVTDLPEPAVLYDEAVLIGTQSWSAPTGNKTVRVPHTVSDTISVEEIAELIGTITYEITCNLTSRIPRVYFRNGKIVAATTLRDGYQRVSS